MAVDNYCRNCRHVRTATQLGVVSAVTKDDELFCGRNPPQVGDATIREEPVYGTTPPGIAPEPRYKTFYAEPICLPPCNEGRGYRGMSCWEPEEGLIQVTFAAHELEVLLNAVVTMSGVFRATEKNTPEGTSDVYTRVVNALSWLRMRAAAEKE